MMLELLAVEGALAPAVAAADARARMPESVEALPAGAPVELWWLDRP